MAAAPGVHSVVLVAGRPQFGKTYYTERIAEKMNAAGGWTFVYNPGRDTDYSGAIEAVPVSPDDMADFLGLEKAERRSYLKKAIIEAWVIDGKFYKSEQIPIAFKGRMVKCYRQIALEQKVFKTMFECFYGGLIVLDDNRASGYRTPNLLELYSRSNHCGKRYTTMPGMNIVTVYHNLDTPPREIYDYLTHIVLFQISRPPDGLKMPELQEAILENFTILADEPKYSRIEMHLMGSEIKSYQHIKK